jgi:hypothetical protein
MLVDEYFIQYLFQVLLVQVMPLPILQNQNLNLLEFYLFPKDLQIVLFERFHQ